MNGHIVNSSAERFPQHNKKFCDECGASTITNCPNCNTEIQGEYHTEGFIDLTGSYKPPAFCHNCGKPYPWTKTKIQAAHELTDELENLSEEEKQILAKSVDDIVKDTPGSELAITRFKKILSKVRDPAIVDTFKGILIGILSETVRQKIWPS